VADTRKCTAATRAGRLAKATQFHLAAETIAATVDTDEVGDAYVTLAAMVVAARTTPT
jgi:hypothetical protein